MTLGEWTAYALYKRGEFPIPVVRIDMLAALKALRERQASIFGLAQGPGRVPRHRPGRGCRLARPREVTMRRTYSHITPDQLAEIGQALSG